MKEVAGAFDSYRLNLPNSEIEDSECMQEYINKRYSDVTLQALLKISDIMMQHFLRRSTNSLY